MRCSCVAFMSSCMSVLQANVGERMVPRAVPGVASAPTNCLFEALMAEPSDASGSGLAVRHLACQLYSNVEHTQAYSSFGCSVSVSLEVRSFS